MNFLRLCQTPFGFVRKVFGQNRTPAVGQMNLHRRENVSDAFDFREGRASRRKRDRPQATILLVQQAVVEQNVAVKKK